MLNAINNINPINRLFSEAKDNQVIRAEDIGGNTSVNVRFYSRKNISDQIWQKLTDWTKGAKNKQALAKKTIINNLNIIKLNSDFNTKFPDENKRKIALERIDKIINITDVNDAIIAEMTQAEKDIYIQVFQDYYSHMSY